MARIAVILKGYPRLSETFIAQEICALEKHGFQLRLISLRHPTDTSTHPIHAEIKASVDYLPEYLHAEPLRFLCGWRIARNLSGYKEARRVWLADLRRDPSRNRVRRFGQACVLAAELPGDVDRLYAHFLHTPASVARYAAIMRNLPWMCSAHAKDIYTSPDWELREKLSSLKSLTTCTAHNVEHLRALAEPDDRSKINLVYHGLDFGRFPAPPTRHQTNGPVRILSVGRAVEKKGYPGLLRALAKLPRAYEWRLTHIGDGPVIGDLKAQSASLGLSDRIDWLGSLPQERVLDAYRNHDVFVLNSRIAGDGDRDGLPNVLMEAQSQGLACIATRISAIPELIEDGESGLLVDADDDAALTSALQRLIDNNSLRTSLGNTGQYRVRERFDMTHGIDTLATLLDGDDLDHKRENP